MTENRIGRPIVRPPTDQERAHYRQALAEEKVGVASDRRLGREQLAERCELGTVVSELKSIREKLNLSPKELADRTGMTVGNLSRLKDMEGPNPTIETLRRYASAIHYRH